jgi:hypothetical protein
MAIPASMRWLKSSTPVIPMQTGMADVPTVLTGPRLFLRSDDRHAGIKKDEQQHEAAHKVPKVTRTNVSQSRMVHMMPDGATTSLVVPMLRIVRRAAGQFSNPTASMVAAPMGLFAFGSARNADSASKSLCRLARRPVGNHLENKRHLREKIVDRSALRR